MNSEPTEIKIAEENVEQATENVRMVAASAPPQLPDFWGNRPAVWFRAVEAKFNLAFPKTNRETTRFEHIICVLPDVDCSRSQQHYRKSRSDQSVYETQRGSH